MISFTFFSFNESSNYPPNQDFHHPLVFLFHRLFVFKFLYFFLIGLFAFSWIDFHNFSTSTCMITFLRPCVVEVDEGWVMAWYLMLTQIRIRHKSRFTGFQTKFRQCRWSLFMSTPDNFCTVKKMRKIQKRREIN